MISLVGGDEFFHPALSNDTRKPNALARRSKTRIGVGVSAGLSKIVTHRPRFIFMLEKTVILVKPDAVERGLIGQIISRFEKAGFKMIAAKLVWLNDELLNQWYAQHLDKPFFPSLAAFMKETPVMAMLWQGERIINRAREICGATDPAKADPGTIRADLGTEIQRNVIHISDSPESAAKEIKLMFSREEILEY